MGSSDQIFEDFITHATTIAGMRDAVAKHPWLCSIETTRALRDQAKTGRGIGRTEWAKGHERLVVDLGLFRSFGPVSGFYEVAARRLTTALATEHVRLLEENPDLRSSEALAYFRRRELESDNIRDTASSQMYRAAIANLERASRANLGELVQMDLATILDTKGLHEHLILGTDQWQLRNFIDKNRPLLEPPLNEAILQHMHTYVFKAYQDVDLPRMRDLVLRQAVLRRCAEVGLERAFSELESGRLGPWNSAQVAQFERMRAEGARKVNKRAGRP